MVRLLICSIIPTPWLGIRPYRRCGNHYFRSWRAPHPGEEIYKQCTPTGASKAIEKRYPAAHAAVYQHKSFRLSDLHLARLDRVLAAQMGTWLPVSSPREGYNLQSNDGRHQKEAPRRTEYSRTRVGLRYPQRDQKGRRHGRSQRECRISHGQTAPGISEGARPSTGQAPCRPVVGEYEQDPQR